jgi:hypothetical protein
MTQVTEAVYGGLPSGIEGGLGYPVASTVARAARGPIGRDGPEYEQDGTA